jgi:ABC-type cobalamin/Fe3+-siderophores transport system ATPase subunit
LWTTATARFWIYGGNTIVVQPLVDSAPIAHSHFILSTCMPTLLNQRGLLAIHANAVVGPQGAIAISGHSGAGKSTLLAALMGRGLPMLADDVTVLQKDIEDRFHVLPGYRSYRLCADTLDQIEPVAERIVDVGGSRKKYLLLAPVESVHPVSVPLHAFYVLRLYEGDTLQIRRAEGMQAFQFIQENCYHPTAMLRTRHAFEQINQVIKQCTIYEIRRPAHRWTVKEMIDLILTLQESLA